MTTAIWPFAVHIVYDEGIPPLPTEKKFETQAEGFAREMHSRLSAGERAPRVPVRLWRSQTHNGVLTVPRRVPLHWAVKNVVVVAVDENLFDRRTAWDECLATLAREATPGRDLILPISMRADASRISASFGDVNHIDASGSADVREDERVFQAVYTAILRQLVPRLPHVFLCHAKADGTPIAQVVRRYLYESSQLSCFFDMHDIPHGHRVKESIENSISDSVILVVWTDKLLVSPWCQMEVIEARKRQRPMLVLDALVDRVPRLFPFLGNMPVVRWQGDPAPIVSAILLELVRTHHLEAVFDARSSGTHEVPRFCLHPPDLLDNIWTEARHEESDDARPRDLLVYPDPPLRAHELEVLRGLVPKKQFLSLAEWQALRAAGELHSDCRQMGSLRAEPLLAFSLGVSLSESDTWSEIGLTAAHQSDISFQIALQLILLGAKVHWGGDLRPDGFGRQLQWIVEAYQHPSRAPQDHVALLVPFTPSAEHALDRAAVSMRRRFADVCLLPSPVASIAQAEPHSAEGRALNALALSAMRSELAELCQVRILLGGGVKKFQGLYPGVAEEGFASVRSGRPIYVVGGFGGAASMVYEAIVAPSSKGASGLLGACRTNGPAADLHVRSAHERLVAMAGKPELAFEPESMVRTLSALGAEGLAERNALSIEENERLATTQDLHEILELLIKGIAAVRARTQRVAQTNMPDAAERC